MWIGDKLISKIEDAVEQGELAAFVGAGLSQPNYPSWKNLLKEPASTLGLDIEYEHDLVSVAQYYCNKNKRIAINNLIRQEFTKSSEPTKNHILLAQLPINTYWTTNYDCLIEKALDANDKRSNVRTSDDHLTLSSFNFDATIYKMHGEATCPESAVITRSDYEEYGYETRKLFREVLEGDLLTKTFIFLGFSFSDPNFNYVIARLRVLLGTEKTRPHYCIMRRVSSEAFMSIEEFEYARIKQQLQIEDLKNYGIDVCLIDDFEEITEILQIVVNKYRRKTIFISGSADHYGKYSPKEGKDFIHKLSYRLAEEGFKIVNGYGLGVGSYVINGVAEYCFRNNQKMNEILTLMPFPTESIDDVKRRELFENNRKLMLEQCGIALFIFGNKKNGENAQGVIKEYKLSEEENIISLPIKCTGGSSKEIYEQIQPSDDEAISRAREVCGKDYTDLADAVEDIVDAIKYLNERN